MSAWLRQRCVFCGLGVGLLLFVVGSVFAEQATTTSVLWGVNGEAWDPDNSILRDFTDVGYKNGAVAIPDESDWPNAVKVTDFGAVPNDGQDDSQAFIDAIAACPANAAVFVPNGRYIILQKIRPTRDYFVLRGEDMYETILYFPKYTREIDPENGGNFFSVGGGTHRSIENFTFQFRPQTKMGFWELRGANAIYYGGNTEDSWIRNIYFKDVDFGITFGTATRISVYNILFDYSIDRPGFVNSNEYYRTIAYSGFGLNGLHKSLIHNVEFKEEVFHEFDIINVPSHNVFSRSRGTDVYLQNHSVGANHNLYTEHICGRGRAMDISDERRTRYETYWNIQQDTLQPASIVSKTQNSNAVLVGISCEHPTTITPTLHYENIDATTLTPSNIYLAQMEKRGKIDNLYLEPMPPPPPGSELTGDVRILNPTDDISGSKKWPNARTLDNFIAYMKFDLRDLQDMDTVAKARVRILAGSRKPNTTFTLNVSAVEDDTWTQESIPDTLNAGAILGSVRVSDSTQLKWWEIDITPYVQEQWETDKVISLYFSQDSGGFMGSMHSRENGKAPQLILERVADPVPGPPAPPTGIRAVGENGYIRLEWDESPESDVVSFTVYRSPGLIGSHPVAQGLTFSDWVDVSPAADWPNRNPMTGDRVFRYTVTAVDKHGYESDRSTVVYASALNSQNDPPTFLAGSHVIPLATAGQAYAGSIAGKAVDPEGDQLYYFKVSGPDWLNVADDGTLSGMPPAGDTGTHEVSIQVAAIGGSDLAVFPLTVESDGSTQWLFDNGLPTDTDLNNSFNAQGLPLLKAFAFGLDPTTAAQSDLPKIEMHDGDMRLRFFGDATGLTYGLSQSLDLNTWTAANPEWMCGPDPEGYYDFNVPSSIDRIFLQFNLLID